MNLYIIDNHETINLQPIFLYELSWSSSRIEACLFFLIKNLTNLTIEMMIMTIEKMKIIKAYRYENCSFKFDLYSEV